MDIFGICICPEHVNEVFTGIMLTMQGGVFYVDQLFRRFGRFFT